METLCRRYWDAIRHYARAAWASDDHDADDLTQEFFIWLLKGDVLQRYAKDQGSFRNYLKGLLRNFGRNHRRAGRRRSNRVGALNLEDGRDVADPRADEGDRTFDREFVGEVTKRALKQLKARLQKGDRAVPWQVFHDYDLSPVEGRPTYAELASRHGIPETAVRNHLHRVRHLLREEIRLELSETVASPAELEEEWRQFTGA
jgi:RNA polymerase sigma-70 factor (ECF subfamily)